MSRVVTSAVLCLLAVVSTALLADDHPLNRWVKQSPREDAKAPGFHYEGSGDYDPFLQRWIHHAGHDGIPQGFHTCTFDLATGRWEQHWPANSPPGVCCVDGSNCFDLANRRLVRFPGGMLGHGYHWSRGERLKDSAVWLYDEANNEWTNMRPPPYKEPEKYSRVAIGGLNSSATYDPDHEVVWSFGGQSSGGGKDTLWAYDAYANRLSLVRGENPPPLRDGHGIAYDSRNQRLVVFGGQYTTDERTWLFDPATNKWEGLKLEPHPPTHKVTKDYSSIPRLAYDRSNGIVLCVAWLGETGHETWALNVAKQEWKKLSPETEPDGSKSRSRNLGYDAARNLFILETSNARGNSPEIWTYRYQDKPAEQDELPLPPSELKLEPHDASRVKLSWKASPTAGVTQYQVIRGEGGSGWDTIHGVLDTVSGTSWIAPAPELATKTYYFAVRSLAPEGKRFGERSDRVRTEPRVSAAPAVLVRGPDQVEIRWNSPEPTDIVGYNLYRGVVHVKAIREGKPGAWSDNDPKYDAPQVVQVRDITNLTKLHEKPLTETSFSDKIDLRQKGPEAGDYGFAVYAYLLRAVNRVGRESGPSPYALTIPSEPLAVMCRENGDDAELRWNPPVEGKAAGYHVYRLEGTWGIVRVTDKPIREATFRHAAGKGKTGRYWVVAIDAIGQEGQPSSPAWFNHRYEGFSEGPWHQ